MSLFSLVVFISKTSFNFVFISFPAVAKKLDLFQSSTPPNNINLTSGNRKADQSLSDLQTGVGAAACATIDTEQLISHLRVAPLDTLSSLPNSEGGIIPLSEVCELLLKVNNILDSAVSQ